MAYSYGNKMGKDGKSGMGNESIAKAGGKSPAVPKAAKLASPGKKPNQQGGMA